jgi:hypothetical protein
MRDLIPTADFGSDGSGWVGEHRRRQETPAIQPAAARLGSSPETRDHEFPGTFHDEIKPRR